MEVQPLDAQHVMSFPGALEFEAGEFAEVLLVHKIRHSYKAKSGFYAEDRNLVGGWFVVGGGVSIDAASDRPSVVRRGGLETHGRGLLHCCAKQPVLSDQLR